MSFSNLKSRIWSRTRTFCARTRLEASRSDLSVNLKKRCNSSVLAWSRNESRRDNRSDTDLFLNACLFVQVQVYGRLLIEQRGYRIRKPLLGLVCRMVCSMHHHDGSQIWVLSNRSGNQVSSYFNPKTINSKFQSVTNVPKFLSSSYICFASNGLRLGGFYRLLCNTNRTWRHITGYASCGYRVLFFLQFQLVDALPRPKCS